MPLNRFVAFTPWTPLHGYVELLAAIDNLGLVSHVAPIQLAIRLPILAESKLLARGAIRFAVKPDCVIAPLWKSPSCQTPN